MSSCGADVPSNHEIELMSREGGSERVLTPGVNVLDAGISCSGTR